MNKNSNPSVPGSADPEDVPGTGALCAEAQADGVPCFELGKECETCGRAALDVDEELEDPPGPEDSYDQGGW